MMIDNSPNKNDKYLNGYELGQLYTVIELNLSYLSVVVYVRHWPLKYSIVKSWGLEWSRINANILFNGWSVHILYVCGSLSIRHCSERQRVLLTGSECLALCIL